MQLTSQAGSRLLKELAALYSLAPLEEFPIKVLAVVHRLIGCDAASYNDFELSSGQFRALVDPAESIDSKVAPAFDRFVHQHPVIAHYEQTGDPRALMISDFLRPVEFRRLGLYSDFFAPLGFNDQLSTTLPASQGGRILGIALNRCGGFNEQDRLLLDILRPHLLVTHRNAVLYSQALTAKDLDEPFASAATAALDRLTERQREVLQLISQGYTNYRIAIELGVRVGTIKKHIEHVLNRLEVQTRVSAARVYLMASHPQETRPWWNVAGVASQQSLS